MENDPLEKKINKTGKKVSIKHYLNTYLFPITETDEQREDINQWKYALYVRVIFNRQSVKIKSQTNLALTFEEFEHLSFEHEKLLKREAYFLTKLVSDIYSTQEIIPKGYNKFKEEFDINLIFGSFKFDEYELNRKVEISLYQKMHQFAIKISDDAALNLLGYIDEISNLKLSSYELLCYFEQSNLKWKSFRNEYTSNFWFFGVYYRLFKLKSLKYNSLGATDVDFHFGDFKNEFLEMFDNKEPKDAINIISDLEGLL